MVLPIGATIDLFDTQVLVSAATTALIAADGFSLPADVVSGNWTNTDDAKEAAITLEGTFATAPTSFGVINLYARFMDIRSNNDSPQPDASFPYSYLGAFPIDTVNTLQAIPLIIGLDNVKTSQVYQFYIENKTSASLSANWALYLTPKGVGQKTA